MFNRDEIVVCVNHRYSGHDFGTSINKKYKVVDCVKISYTTTYVNIVDIESGKILSFVPYDMFISLASYRNFIISQTLNENK